MSRQTLFGLLFIALAQVGNATEPHASVFVIRHCVRAPGTSYFCMGGDYSQDPNAYAAEPWPEWPVDTMLCTPQGKDIVKGQGKFFRPTLPPGPIRFVPDNITRDVTTAEKLAEGLGIRHPNLQVDGALYDPSKYGVCPPMSVADRDAAIKEALDNNLPLPSNLKELLTGIQNASGKGKAPAMQDIPTSVGGGEVEGGICAGAFAAERFLLEKGSGMEVGWGRVSDADLTKYLELEMYTMWIINALNISRHNGSNLLNAVTQTLKSAQSQDKPGSTFYVGHDTNLAQFGQLLELSWEQEGFPQNTTNPGSALRFDLYEPTSDQGEWTVTITHWGVTDFSSKSGEMTTTPVHIPGLKNNTATWGQYHAQVLSQLDPNCVQA